jgi:hypothetical protein
VHRGDVQSVVVVLQQTSRTVEQPTNCNRNVLNITHTHFKPEGRGFETRRGKCYQLTSSLQAY